jgi:hypothetical protein
LNDESVPSGNGVASRVLQRLGHLIGEPRYLNAARRTLELASEQMSRIPYAHASLLAALEEHLTPPETIVIRGDGADLARWIQIAQCGYTPRRLAIAIPAGETDLPGTLTAMQEGGGTRAYRCIGTRCEPPIENRGDLERVLGGV